MTTITLWLLVNIGTGWQASHITHVVERFATAADCNTVRAAIAATGDRPYPPVLRCIEAKVARP